MAALIVRFILGAAFLIAGAAKFAGFRDSKSGLKEFGIPSRLLALSAWLLASVEILTGLLLFPSSTAIWGAMAALGLSVIFAGAVLAALARGKRPNCQCFGSLYSRPISRWTLGRVGIVAAGAGYVFQAATRMSPLPIDIASIRIPESASIFLAILLGAAFVTIAIAHFRLLKKHGAALLELETAAASAWESAPATRPAPSFGLPSAEGRTETLGSLLSYRRPVLLVFSDPECPTCQSLLPELGKWAEDFKNSVTVAVIGNRSASENSNTAPIRHYLFQSDKEVAQAYGAPGVPSAVVVSADGQMSSVFAKGPSEIMQMADQLLLKTASIPAIPERVITPFAKGITVTNLDGDAVDFASQIVEETLVVFWDPECAHSLELQAQLETYASWLRDTDASLVLITPKAVRPAGVLGRGLVLVDSESRLQNAFGVSATPAAVILDGSGEVASFVAIGMSRVLEIAGALVPAKAA
jgi:thiol-disulfide isomerase/thioredoxin